MELSLEAELYTPSVDDNGMYIDKIPNMANGIRCPCCSRKDKLYSSRQQFATHIKSKTHIKWLQDQNNNRANFFVENIRLNETIKYQQQIIAKMEKDLQNKLLTIDYLTKMLTLHKPNENTVNLLDFDV
jgi:hypothetical protein